MAIKLNIKVLFVFCVFLYVILAGLFIQFIFLPHLYPKAHYGEGILVGTDTIFFHTEAVKIANEIKDKGFQIWSLKPEPHYQIMIGITSFIYAVTGIHKPYIMLFYNAFLHSFAAFFLVKLLENFGINTKIAILSSLPFVFFPSSLSWIAQIHRDGLYILGFLLVFWSISEVSKSSIKNFFYALLGQIVGLYLIYLARAHMIIPFKHIFIFVFLGSLVALSFFVFKRKKIKPVLLNLLGISILVIIFSNQLAPQIQSLQIQSPQIQSPFYWVHQPFIPEKLDRILANIADWRYRFLYEYYREAKGNIEENFLPHKATDFLIYLPRGLFVGFFYPTPDFWFKEGGTYTGTLARYVVPFETAILWISLFAFPFALYNLRKELSIYLMLILCFIFVYFHVVTEPNIGPIVRKRYVFIGVIISIAFSYLLQKWVIWKREKLS